MLPSLVIHTLSMTWGVVGRLILALESRDIGRPANLTIAQDRRGLTQRLPHLCAGVTIFPPSLPDFKDLGLENNLHCFPLVEHEMPSGRTHPMRLLF